MATTDLTPGARRVLDAASRLFYGTGIHAVGVDAIAAEAGVTKKTLYDRFGSKEGLVAAYLRARDEEWRSYLESYVTERGDDPGQQLLDAFDALATWSAERSPRGCSFVNAHAELPDPDHAGRRAILEQKRWMTAWFATRGRAAGLRDPDSVADDLMLLYDGALVTRGMHTVDDAIARARRIATAIMATASPPLASRGGG
jgi:AcrR family transcriptional regulator